MDTSPNPSAQWVRDPAYLAAAVRLAHLDRPAGLRFMAPLLMTVLVALMFSPWGILSVLSGWGSFLTHLPAMLMFLVLIALASSQAYPSMLQANLRRYAFAGDRARWEASAEGLHYRVEGPDGSERHEARSRWSWWNVLSVDPTGLRLHRPGSVEAYAIPWDTWQAATPEARAGEQAAVVELARAAGVRVRCMTRWDRAGLAGALAGLAVLLTQWMALCSIFAALPFLRRWDIGALQASAIDTFWWAGLLLAPLVLALHLGLAVWQQRRTGAGRPVPALWPHLVLALGWAALLLAALESLRALVFDDALAASRYAAPLPVVIGAVLALLVALVLHRAGVAYWAVRRAALHNAGSTRLESP